MSPPAATLREQSLVNLSIAFNGEANAAVRYAAFAKRADGEGYFQTGSLFRAVARSEQIHAANHAAMILKMGCPLRPMIELPIVKSTIENLNRAIDDEFYEVNELYPGFVLEAEAQAHAGVRRTLQYALTSERGHLQRFLSAWEKIELPETTSARILPRRALYYVCAECGYTTERIGSNDCPICRHCKDEFELIS